MICYDKLIAVTNVKQHLKIESKEIKLENVPNKAKPLIKKICFNAEMLKISLYKEAIIND